jgi:hypothetical protein
VRGFSSGTRASSGAQRLFDNPVFSDISLSSSENEKCFKTKIVEKIKTHIIFKIFFFENRTVYEVIS